MDTRDAAVAESDETGSNAAADEAEALVLLPLADGACIISGVSHRLRRANGGSAADADAEAEAEAEAEADTVAAEPADAPADDAPLVTPVVAADAAVDEAAAVSSLYGGRSMAAVRVLRTW